MKVYTADYSRKEFIRIYFSCDESLDPLNNIDDYEFVRELISEQKFLQYEHHTDTHLDEYDIDIQLHTGDVEPNVVLGRDHFTEYERYVETS